MKKKHIILSFLLFFSAMTNVNAAICGKTDIIKVKEEAQDITIEYKLVQNNDGSDNVSGLFDIKMNGLSEKFIIEEETTNKSYAPNASGTLLLENVEGGNLIFKIYYKNCNKKLMRTIKLNLPKYNVYSLRKECEGINEDDLEICGKWYQGELNDEIFNKKIKEYQEELQKEQEKEKNKTIFEKVIEIILDYYIYIISTIMIIVTITLVITVKRRRASLE